MRVNNIAKAIAAPRCLATNRRGSPCQRPAMRGKRRCNLHGGKSTGAPGNRNAWKHGLWSNHDGNLRHRSTAINGIVKATGLPATDIPRGLIEASTSVTRLKSAIRKERSDD